MRSLLHIDLDRIAEHTAAQLDAADPLHGARAHFSLPPDKIYLAGNSLGPLPEGVAQRLAQVVQSEWGQGAVSSWNRAGWIAAPARIGERLGPLLGAAPGQVLACDATTVNLFKLLGAALRLRPQRPWILAEESAFPSDGYIAAAAGEWLGRRVRRVPSAELAGALDSDVAVALINHVDYRSGALLDMHKLCAAAAARGVITLWDISHSAGVMPLELDAAGADLAVGCGYKFLCGGPGAPSFVYVRSELQGALEQPLQGWLGHASPFAFEAGYRPAAGVQRLLCGTPPMLSLLALESALEVLAQFDLRELRAKSAALGAWLLACVERECAGLGVELASPRTPAERGSQLTLRHPQAYPVMQALIARGVVGDYREPNLLRFGLAPHYLSFAELESTAQQLGQVLREGEHRDPRFQQRAYVT